MGKEALFSPEEMKLVEKLRKRQRQWRWARWVYVTVGTLFFGVAAGNFYMVDLGSEIYSEVSSPVDRRYVLFFAVFWTKGCFHFLLGVVYLILAALHWRGNPTNVLLLKLIDLQERRNEEGK